MKTAVMTVAPAPAPEAAAHFEDGFRFETDCWDVHDALSNGAPDFVLLDVRGPDLFARGHVPGSINLPHRKIVESTIARFGAASFVVYCAGPHCNGAQRAALRLARLGRPVKLMVGGITGWLDEGFSLETGDAAGGRSPLEREPEAVAGAK